MPNKAIAAGGTAAVAGAVTTVILSLLGHPVSADVAGSIQTIVTAVLSALAAWWTKMEGGA